MVGSLLRSRQRVLLISATGPCGLRVCTGPRAQTLDGSLGDGKVPSSILGREMAWPRPPKHFSWFSLLFFFTTTTARGRTRWTPHGTRKATAGSSVARVVSRRREGGGGGGRRPPGVSPVSRQRQVAGCAPPAPTPPAPLACFVAPRWPAKDEERRRTTSARHRAHLLHGASDAGRTQAEALTDKAGGARCPAGQRPATPWRTFTLRTTWSVRAEALPLPLCPSAG